MITGMALNGVLFGMSYGTFIKMGGMSCVIGMGKLFGGAEEQRWCYDQAEFLVTIKNQLKVDHTLWVYKDTATDEYYLLYSRMSETADIPSKYVNIVDTSTVTGNSLTDIENLKQRIITGMQVAGYFITPWIRL